MTPPRIVFIGLGGNSFGPLLLALYLANKHPNAELVLVDGKTYKASHGDHEFFLRPGPKAHVQAQLVTSAYPRLKVTPVLRFIDRTTTDHTISTKDLLHEGDYIVLVVDNHETRKLIAEHASTMTNSTLISGAIDGDDVGIWIALRRNANDLTPTPLQRYADIANAPNTLPAEMFQRTGCIEEGLTTTDEERPNYFALLSTTMLTLNALWQAIELDHEGRITEFPYVDTWLNVRTAAATPNNKGA